MRSAEEGVEILRRQLAHAYRLPAVFGPPSDLNAILWAYHHCLAILLDRENEFFDITKDWRRQDPMTHSDVLLKWEPVMTMLGVEVPQTRPIASTNPRGGVQ